jgi:Protein of unknown function (DUF2867)
MSASICGTFPGYRFAHRAAGDGCRLRRTGRLRPTSLLDGESRSCYRSPPLRFHSGGRSMARVARVDLPQRSVLKPLYAKAGFADAFAIDLPSNATDDAERLAAHVLTGQAPWVGWLIALRDTLVAGFGLKTSSELRDDVATDRIDFFRVYDRRRHEIILGEDDRHLDFRLSVLVEESALCRRLVATTVVTFNHLGGRAYIAGIAPFHRLIVKSSLRRAERSGWPSEL